MRRRALLAGTALVVAATLVVRACASDGRLPPGAVAVPTPAGAHGRAAAPFADPFAWRPDRRQDLVARAAAGLAHPLYAFSPGGVERSATRTAHWRPLVEGAAGHAGISADALEGLVFLESAGRADAVTPAGFRGAAGLTQIVAGTGIQLLGMHVDPVRAQRLTRRIARLRRRHRRGAAAALVRARARIDERFDPRKALAATARYLAQARARFGREDLAIESYHMGMGNLSGVLRAFGDPRADYAQVYFDSTPLRHRAAFRRLSGFADDSPNYLWKVHAAEAIMGMSRNRPDALRRTAALQTAKASAEEVLHPASSSPRFPNPGALRKAWDAGDIVGLPDRPGLTGLRRAAQMGELADRLRVAPDLYRGLRPAALALALYMAAQVRAATDPSATLEITSTVRDQRYQDLLVRSNREATQAYSLHTTGWAFDVSRRYASPAQAHAFQWVLDRLQALDLIAWVREPAAIHITVSAGAAPLLPLLDRLK